MSDGNGKTETAVAPQKSLDKAQLLAYFKRRFEQNDQRSDIVKELYDKTDLTLVTEYQAQIILPMVGVKVYEAALDPNRTKPLIQVWRESYNECMVAFRRQGRLELLGGLQALQMESGGDERAVRG